MKIVIEDCKEFYRTIKDRVGKNVNLIFLVQETGVTFYWFSPDNVAFIVMKPNNVRVEDFNQEEQGEIPMYNLTTLINKGKADDKVVMEYKGNRFDVELVGSKDLGMEVPIHVTERDPSMAHQVMDKDYGDVSFFLEDGMLSDGIDMISKSGSANDSIVLETFKDGNNSKVRLREANTQTNIKATDSINGVVDPITTRFKRDYLCDLLENMVRPNINLGEEEPLIATDKVSTWVIAPRIE